MSILAYPRRPNVLHIWLWCYIVTSDVVPQRSSLLRRQQDFDVARELVVDANGNTNGRITKTQVVHGPVAGERSSALDYFRHWHWRNQSFATAPKQRELTALPTLTQLAGAEDLWSSNCHGQSDSESLQLVRRTADNGVHHYLFRAARDRLQYVAFGADGKVLMTDPPMCKLAASKKALFIEYDGSEQDSNVEGAFVEDISNPGSNEDMLDPNGDPLVQDCVRLFHREAKSICNKEDFVIQVLHAAVRIIDGLAVVLGISVSGATENFFHIVQCDFEETIVEQKPVPLTEQVQEEKDNMRSTLVMNTELCAIDQESSVSGEEAGALEALAQVSTGELSFYKGYRHVNDGIPAWNSSMEEVDVQVPTSLDWRTVYPECFPNNGVGAMRMQGDCGSCWAFAGASSAMHSICVGSRGVGALTGSGARYEVSVQQLMSCNGDRKGCNGGWAALVRDVLQRDGIVKETDSPYQCNRGSALNHFESGGSCAAYPWNGACTPTLSNSAWQFDNIYLVAGEAAMKQALSLGRGVYATMWIYDNFMSYTSGIYTYVSGSKLGAHAVALVGYAASGSTQYWVVQNSWDSTWGENGYFRHKRGTNLCSIESEPFAFTAGQSTRRRRSRRRAVLVTRRRRSRRRAVLVVRRRRSRRRAVIRRRRSRRRAIVVTRRRRSRRRAPVPTRRRRSRRRSTGGATVSSTSTEADGYTKTQGKCGGGSVTWSTGYLEHCSSMMLSSSACRAVCDSYSSCWAYRRPTTASGLTLTGDAECCLFKAGNTGNGEAGFECYVKGSEAAPAAAPRRRRSRRRAPVYTRRRRTRRRAPTPAPPAYTRRRRSRRRAPVPARRRRSRRRAPVPARRRRSRRRAPVPARRRRSRRRTTSTPQVEYTTTNGQCRGGLLTWSSGQLWTCSPTMMTNSECAATCDSYSSCWAYDRPTTASGAECCLYKAGNTGNGAAGRECHVKAGYVKVDGFCWLGDSNYPDNDERAEGYHKTEAQMESICDSDANCKGFQMNGNGWRGIMVGATPNPCKTGCSSGGHTCHIKSR